MMWSLWMWITTFRLHTASLISTYQLYAVVLSFDWIEFDQIWNRFPLWSAAAQLSCYCFLTIIVISFILSVFYIPFKE